MPNGKLPNIAQGLSDAIMRADSASAASRGINAAGKVMKAAVVAAKGKKRVVQAGAAKKVKVVMKAMKAKCSRCISLM